MDSLSYPVSLLVVALAAFAFNRNNSPKLMLLSLAIGVYVIYSHESGNTITTLKKDMIESIDKSAKEFVQDKSVRKEDETVKTAK